MNAVSANVSARFKAHLPLCIVVQSAASCLTRSGCFRKVKKVKVQTIFLRCERSASIVITAIECYTCELYYYILLIWNQLMIWLLSTLAAQSAAAPVVLIMYRHPLRLAQSKWGGGFRFKLNQLYLMPANPNNENCLSIYNSQNLLKLVLDLTI